MSQRKATEEDFYRMLWQNLPVTIIYTILLFGLPIYLLIDAQELLPYLSLIYQILGIRLLYVDEKHKMSRVDRTYGKANTFFLNVFNSPGRSRSAIKQIRRIRKQKKIGVSNSNCNLTLDIKVTAINHDYEKIEDEKERKKQQLISMQSDLGMLKYFSAVRRAGYLIMGIGFVLQFLAIIWK